MSSVQLSRVLLRSFKTKVLWFQSTRYSRRLASVAIRLPSHRVVRDAWKRTFLPSKMSSSKSPLSIAGLQIPVLAQRKKLASARLIGSSKSSYGRKFANLIDSRLSRSTSTSGKLYQRCLVSRQTAIPYPVGWTQHSIRAIVIITQHRIRKG